MSAITVQSPGRRGCGPVAVCVHVAGQRPSDPFHFRDYLKPLSFKPSSPIDDALVPGISYPSLASRSRHYEPVAHSAGDSPDLLG